MKYKLTCNSCNKPVTVSSHDAVKFTGSGNKDIVLDFDCPECGESIEVKKVMVGAR